MALSDMGRKPQFTKQYVLDAINKWIAGHGQPPTIEELAEAINAGSTRTAFRYLRLLEDENMIRRWPGARGMRPLRQSDQGYATRRIPMVGEAPAGSLMTAQQNIDTWLKLPEESLKPAAAEYFLLRVRGNSMNRARVSGELVENGDLILVRQQASAEPGEIVVALIDGEATIKRLVRGDGYYLLKPESTETHETILLESEFSVQGIVVRVLKRGSEILDSGADETEEE